MRSDTFVYLSRGFDSSTNNNLGGGRHDDSKKNLRINFPLRFLMAAINNVFLEPQPSGSLYAE